MEFKDVRVSPHTFRHTFCHRLAISGMSAYAIQKMMRRKNNNVTMRYVAMWGNELKEQNDKHPLNNLDMDVRASYDQFNMSIFTEAL